ncbi:hypothetical protein SAMN05216436_106148 [bacterium A37T11]|nr:hypothetical protein SAMN05216436_106148 [bacterium A37T11]
MKKRSKLLALGLTIALALGFIFGTYAHNRKVAMQAETPNHYSNGTVCTECIDDNPGLGFECTANNSGTRCTCDDGARLATTAGNNGAQPCAQLWKNPVQ